ncbi:metallophosphoesterase [Sulfurimonas sp.]|uniref:metallophosphoesterase n=1 Tax=Sulfurimonas sp. TaxID=2022749 RepID=UPI0035695631
MHYVIGDVHGNYKTLLALVQKLPSDATIVFVGDLVDRAGESAEVVKFIRDNAHLCVMGNHEEMMVTFGKLFINNYENDRSLPSHSIWFSNGGIDTLLSYGLISLVDTGCNMHTYGYSQLSAYCVESGETVSVQRVQDGYKKVVKKDTSFR